MACKIFCQQMFTLDVCLEVCKMLREQSMNVMEKTGFGMRYCGMVQNYGK